jgi:hypothetical protein
VLLAFGLVIAAMIFQALTSPVLGVLIVVIIATPLPALGRLTGSPPGHITAQIQHLVIGSTHNPSKLLGPVASFGASVAARVAAIIVVLLTALSTAIPPEPRVNGLVRMFPIARRPQVSSHPASAADDVCRVAARAARGHARARRPDVHRSPVGRLAVRRILCAVHGDRDDRPVLRGTRELDPADRDRTHDLDQGGDPGRIIYVVAHQVESNLIQPLVVARTVKLHPAVVAIGVVAVDQLFGFIGLLIAVPLIAAVSVLVDKLWVRPLERGTEQAPLEQVRRSAAEGLTVRARR